MLNLKDVTGVESSPISKSILENSLGSTRLSDSKAFSNYEFLADLLKQGGYKVPSVLYASGNGEFYPKTTAYAGDFYSSSIFGRDGYKNSWQSAYRIDESYEITYYDGASLFKGFRIDPSTGKVRLKYLETRNGNLPNQAGAVQHVLGYNATSSTDDESFYKHSFRTRHSPDDNSQNAIDIFLWDFLKDAKSELGSKRVLSLYGTGSVEIVSGTEIFGALDKAIATTTDKDAERNDLAIEGKGVIYYNKSKNRFRYSENGENFKYLGSGDGSGEFAIETCSLNKCVYVKRPRSEGDKYQGTIKSYAFVVRMHSHEKARIKKIYVPCKGGSMQVAVYSDSISPGDENGPSKYNSEQLIAYNPQYSGRNAGGAGTPFYYGNTVKLDGSGWLFYERYNSVNVPSLNEAIVSGNFAIAISVNWDATGTIESVIGELMPYFVDSVDYMDNLTGNGQNGMNFEMMTYSYADDTDSTSNSKYTKNSSPSDRISRTILGEHFSKKLNFVPYVKVVLEKVEEE